MKKVTIISLSGVAAVLLACNSGGTTGSNAKYTVTGIAGANPIIQTAANKCNLSNTAVNCDVESGVTGLSNLTVAANVTPNAYIVNPTNLPAGLSITYSGGQTGASHIEGNLVVQCKPAEMNGATSAKYTIQLNGDNGTMNYINVQCNKVTPAS